jgi:hypothetical protein
MLTFEKARFFGRWRHFIPNIFWLSLHFPVYPALIHHKTTI